MALDSRYITSSDLETLFRDKDSGLPLANGVLRCYRDVARSELKSIYQLTGSPGSYSLTTELPNPLTLSSIGTVQNAAGDNEIIYWFPYYTQADGDVILDLYYIEVYDEDGVLQFTREAWPNVTEETDPTQDAFPVQNQISNSQFTKILINDGIDTTLTVSGAASEEFPIAPNWLLIISGTGTVTVSRNTLTGNDAIVTSPPYSIEIETTSGITACYLTQRFSTNSGLWASSEDQSVFLSGCFVAKFVSGATVTLEMFYDESTGLVTPVSLVTAPLTADYALYKGSSDEIIPESNNTDSGIDGYIDIYVAIPPSAHVAITSLQVVPIQSDLFTDQVNYDLNSSNREMAYMGDYFIPNLVDRNTKSILTGWDFPLNPGQFGTSGNVTTTAGYILDQTIACTTGANIAFAKSSLTGGLQLTTSDTTQGCYILQYLDAPQAQKIIGTKLSVNVNAYIDAIPAVTMRVYLFRGSSAASFPTLATTIGTVATTGVFTLSAANWTEIPRSNLDTATASLNVLTTNATLNETTLDYAFSGWEITDSTQIGDTDKFAIVVSFGYTTGTPVITVNSVSVIPGEIPARPAIQSADDVLRECQYYYENSYDLGTAVGTVVSGISNETEWYIGASDTHAIAGAFTVHYKQSKRLAPTFTFYSTSTGTSDKIFCRLYHNNAVANSNDQTPSSFWTITSKTAYTSAIQNSTSDLAINAGVITNIVTANINYHYVADSRLGIV